MTARTLLAALIVGASPAFAADIGAPDFYDNSAYTLTKVDAAGDNTITKFEYNTATQTFEPVFYRVDLKQTEFGEGALSEEFQIPVLGKDVTIKFNYDDASTGNYEHVYKDITKDLGTVTNADIPEDREIIKIGGAVEIDSDTVENAIFQNNTTTGGSTVSGQDSYDLAVSVRFKGGALYNDKNLNKINADFIGNANEAKKLSGIYVGVRSNGGAIYNDTNGTIGEINGNFINNYTTDYGSAIYNAGKINNINGTFYNTSASDSYSASAIYNDGEIGSISALFLNNPDRALYNSGTIESVQSTFIGNTDTGLYNYGDIDTLNSDFIGNGRGISNSGHIGTITGSFLGNNIGIYNSSGANIEAIRANFIGSEGSAIYNPYTGSTNIGTIESNFVDNHANNGGAIYNNKMEANTSQGKPNIYISNISSNFINNRATYSGGAIYNSNISTISQISNSLFLENTASQGGAIANTITYSGSGIINKITDTQFINNSAQSDRDSAFGGAIYNHTTIGGTTSIGSILSRDTITYEKTVLINSETGESITGYGVTQIDGAYTRLTPEQLQEYIAAGGKVLRYNKNTRYTDSTRFEQDKTYFEEDIANGVYSTVPVEIPEANIVTTDDVIANINTTTVPISNSVFIGNHAKSQSGDALGGAIYNDGTIGGKVSDLQDWSEDRKAPYVDIDFDKLAESIPANRASIENSSFYNNYAESESGNAKGGAIYTTGMYLDKDDYGNNTYRQSTLHISAKDDGQSVFSGNYTVSNGVKTPNAIYLDVSPEIEIQDQLVSIDTTSVTTADITTKAVPTLILDASTNGVIQFDDPIDGAQGSTETVTTTADLNVAEWYLDDYGSTVEEFVASVKTLKPFWYHEDMTDKEILAGAYNRDWLVVTNEQSTTETSTDVYSIHITGDDTGKVILNNDVTAHTYDADGKETGLAPVNISLEKTNLYLGARDDVFNGNNLDLKSGSMSMVNDAAGVSALNSLTVSGDTNFVADVDLAAKEMDRFTASEYGSHTGNLNVVGMNLLSDANMDEDVTAVYFAEPGLKNNVVNGTGELPDSYQTAYTPIYKYNVTYDNENEYDGKGDGGYFLFTRGDKIIYPDGGGGSTGNDSDAFNPAVLATPVGNLAAGQAAVNEAFKYVFEHADAFTQLPAMERYAKINANKYALSTDFNDNLPEYVDQLHNNAVWFRPYTTFETMNLENGPDVDAITYGSLVGFDGDFKEMKNGWHRVFTGYAGYMGSSLNYSGVDTSMNGGLLGFTETFYKGNFWTAITASAGASVGESHTMYGKEDYTSLLAGVGSKTGYNFEFKDGKFIIQPIMYLSYTFVNTFDYKNAAGVNIESDPLHTIQLNPSVRFIANLKGGWQPYASVGMVWNLMNESKVTANNVKLPEMSVKPYVEYGVGVQRNWADKFTAFLQAMIRNGGRNGIALTGGFRFMLGSDNDNSDKPKVKKEIKSL